MEGRPPPFQTYRDGNAKEYLTCSNELSHLAGGIACEIVQFLDFWRFFGDFLLHIRRDLAGKRGMYVFVYVLRVFCTQIAHKYLHVRILALLPFMHETAISKKVAKIAIFHVFVVLCFSCCEFTHFLQGRLTVHFSRGKTRTCFSFKKVQKSPFLSSFFSR